jgi:hypothetical protein
MKTRILYILLAVVLTCSGCFFNSDGPYEFRQTFDQIVSIEILRKEYDSVLTDTPMSVIYTVEPAEHQGFIDNLMEIEGGRVGLDPNTGFGMYIIRITYKNGEMEMIGNYNNGYITPNGEVHQDIYAFDSVQYYAFLSDVLGREITDWYYH